MHSIPPAPDRLGIGPLHYERLADGLNTGYLLSRINRIKFYPPGEMLVSAACVGKWTARLAKTALITPPPVGVEFLPTGKNKCQQRRHCIESAPFFPHDVVSLTDGLNSVKFAL